MISYIQKAYIQTTTLKNSDYFLHNVTTTKNYWLLWTLGGKNTKLHAITNQPIKQYMNSSCILQGETADFLSAVWWSVTASFPYQCDSK